MGNIYIYLPHIKWCRPDFWLPSTVGWPAMEAKHVVVDAFFVVIGPEFLRCFARRWSFLASNSNSILQKMYIQYICGISLVYTRGNKKHTYTCAIQEPLTRKKQHSHSNMACWNKTGQYINLSVSHRPLPAMTMPLSPKHRTPTVLPKKVPHVARYTTVAPTRMKGCLVSTRGKVWTKHWGNL